MPQNRGIAKNYILALHRVLGIYFKAITKRLESNFSLIVGQKISVFMLKLYFIQVFPLVFKNLDAAIFVQFFQ